MIRFFCERCGKEIWQQADWDHIKRYTLELIKEQLVCSACLFAEFRQEAENKK